MANVIPVNSLWESMLEQAQNDIREVVEWLKDDAKNASLNNSKLDKLLRLASCNASPVGEKTNAAKAAFRILVAHFN
jgi:hypothetical protein